MLDAPFLKKNFLRLLILRIGFFISGLLFGQSLAAQRLHLTNEAYQLEISEKSDLKLLLAGSKWSNGYSNQLNLDEVANRRNVALGFSPFDKISLIGSYIQANGYHTENPSYWNAQHLELAIGTYHTFHREDPEKGYVKVDLFVGKGWGDWDQVFPTAATSFLKYQRNFVHSGIHLCLGPYFTFSAGYRFVRLRYQEIQSIGPIPMQTNRRIDTIETKNPANLVEASYQVKAGPKEVQFFLSRTASRRSKPLGKRNSSFAPVNKIGIIFGINSIFKKKIT